jgi:hypothetical protein
MKLKTKREALFIIIGIFLLLITGWTIFYSINFLLKNVDESLNQKLAGSKEITGFNLEGLKELEIIK